MTYSSRLKVHISKQVYTQELVRSDKFIAGQQKILDRKVIDTDEREVYIGSILVMINSDDKDDCDYDQGGYFIVKGAEKGRSTCLIFESMEFPLVDTCLSFGCCGWIGDFPYRRNKHVQLLSLCT